jgi:Co/Zn/Cd efflux system component
MSANCDNCKPRDLAHATPAYRRALWIVVVLNLGMGGAEMAGGFLAASQSLKADALDFVGDGAITFLGLMALRWKPAWRARSAFAQGLFLALLGIGVLTATAYRAFARQMPEPETMGWFGLVALAVNISAALLLLPHRAGDASIRAVWLFSRNDAIGNLMVIGAAAVVAWTRTPWPDLAVAAIVAGLFLHSAGSILREARVELRCDHSLPDRRS